MLFASRPTARFRAVRRRERKQGGSRQVRTSPDRNRARLRYRPGPGAELQPDRRRLVEPQSRRYEQRRRLVPRRRLRDEGAKGPVPLRCGGRSARVLERLGTRRRMARSAGQTCRPRGQRQLGRPGRRGWVQGFDRGSMDASASSGAERLPQLRQCRFQQHGLGRSERDLGFCAAMGRGRRLSARRRPCRRAREEIISIR